MCRKTGQDRRGKDVPAVDCAVAQDAVEKEVIRGSAIDAKKRRSAIVRSGRQRGAGLGKKNMVG